MGGGRQEKLRVRAAAWKNERWDQRGMGDRNEEGAEGGWAGCLSLRRGRAQGAEAGSALRNPGDRLQPGTPPPPSPSLVLGVEGAARLRRAQGVGPPVLPFPAEMQVEGAEGTEAEEVGAGRG